MLKFFVAFALASACSLVLPASSAAIFQSVGTQACSTSFSSGTTKLSLIADGLNRTFQVYVPSGVTRAVAAKGLILNFHGYTSNGWQQQFLTSLPQYASNFIQIAPDGTTSASDANRGWNAGGCCGGSTKLNIPDVSFALELVKFAKANFPGCFPERAVFATGFSNGGFMSHRLACEASDVFLAVAPHSGYLSLGGDFTVCSPTRAASILHIHGSSDKTVPIASSFGTSYEENKRFWVEEHKCNATPTVQGFCELYTGCRDDSTVEFCLVQDLPHSWSFKDEGLDASAKIAELFTALADKEAAKQL